MNANRDILDLTEKSVGGPLSTMDDSLWENLGLPIDFHPWFGWNVPGPGQQMAIGMSIAMQCASVKAKDIAKAGMVMWRRDAQRRGRWEEVTPDQHPFAKLLARRPNTIQTWSRFWRMTVMHLELVGNAYILKRYNARGEIVELLPIQPVRVRRLVNPDTGRVFYEIYAGTDLERAQLGYDVIRVREDRMIHLVGKTLDGVDGISNAAIGNPLFDLVGAISRYQTKLFGSDGRQPMVFEMKDAFPSNEMGDAAFRRLKDQLSERSRKMNAAGDPILLEAGLTAKPVAVNSKDAMTIEAYNQQVNRICGLMEMPPHKIYHYESVKYDNQSAADAQYANSVLIPIADDIEETFRNALLPEDEWDTFWPEFDRRALMAGDPKTLMEVIDKAVKDGLMEVNEARELLPLGLSPIPGGDVRYVPVAMAIVDRNGKVIQQAATGQNQGAGQDGNAAPQGDNQQRSFRVIEGGQ